MLDRFLKEDGAEKIDYVHGADVTVRLGSQPGKPGDLPPGDEKDGSIQDSDSGWCVTEENLFDG